MHSRKVKTKTGLSQRGIALFVSLLFVAIFSSFGLAILTMSSRNMRVANNHSQAGRALESALSGMEVMKYWMSKVAIPGATASSQRFSSMSADLANYIAVGSENPVTLDSSDPRSFYAQLQFVDNDTFSLIVTGQAGQLQRSVAMNYTFGVSEDTIFNFGIATKGPLQLTGNVQLDGATSVFESDIYIESSNNNDVLSITGNSQIAGEIRVTNPNGMVTLQGGQAGIGGETGQAAINNHVETGVAPVDFPIPNTARFEQYANGDVIDSETGTSGNNTFENARVLAGVNPLFNGNVIINGIMFIETPNVVNFSGNLDVNGLIIGDGNVTDDSGTNELIFQGNVESHSVSELPAGSQFDGLREETGTFLLAPGFKLSFGGNFDTINGVIAGNGVTFFGNAGGTIAGSVINYAETPMTVTGNCDLYFDRSGVTEVPAGFDPEIVLYHDPTSYDEPVL